MPKYSLGIDVLTAAQQRIEWTFDNFPRIYCSFSAGKDSGVMAHMVLMEARKRGCKVGLFFLRHCHHRSLVCLPTGAA